MPRKAKELSSWTVEEHGVRVRVYRRGGRYVLDVRASVGYRGGRRSAKTSDRSTADAAAHDYAREIAKQQILGIKPETLTLGELIAAYMKGKGWGLKENWRRAANTRANLFIMAWGEDRLVAEISETSVKDYCAKRSDGRIAPPLRARQIAAGKPVPPLRPGALDSDFAWLSSAFNWARSHKLPSGERLLSHNPLHDCKRALPREAPRMIRRPKASPDRYARTLTHADAIDPEGRLRLILALARYTGRRESAITQLRVKDMLLSPRSVAQALASAGMDEGDAAMMPHGAIYWSADTDKQAVLHVTPISEPARSEIERYLAQHARIGDVPLFPGPKHSSLPISRVIAYRWLMKAERLAGLDKLSGGGFHPYRRLWASERKHLADVDVAAAGGWGSTKTLAIYQQSDPASVLAAVQAVG